CIHFTQSKSGGQRRGRRLPWRALGDEMMNRGVPAREPLAFRPPIAYLRLILRPSSFGAAMPPSRGFTTPPVYMCRQGVLASGHYLAARAGQRMFDKGGNAIDATVASGYALNLLEPQNNGLGGEVPILVYSAKDKKAYAISGQGFVGKAATVDYFVKAKIDLIPGDGFLPATVPAMFGSWAFALMRFGTLTLKDVLEPVIGYRESGCPVCASLRRALAGLARRFREE